jgi:hypothetical protein
MDSIKPKAVISLFDKTGNAVKPWAEKGYISFCFDIQHKGERREGNIWYVGLDVLSPECGMYIIGLKERYDVVFTFAFPPCTDLAVSGARWFAAKERKSPGTRKRAMELVYRAQKIAEFLGAPFALENPVSVISTEWRKPDYTFHPWEYAALCEDDNYTKKTCLWTGNGFIMPEKQPLHNGVKPDDRIHKAAPGPERANFRSATPMGFAKAVFLANHNAPKQGKLF